MIEFQWDPTKARDNLKKHGVSFEEARSVFFDEYARQFFDEEHSDDEQMSSASSCLVSVIDCAFSSCATVSGSAEA
jgi:uncharacterized DUF497 family protein